MFDKQNVNFSIQTDSIQFNWNLLIWKNQLKIIQWMKLLFLFIHSEGYLTLKFLFYFSLLNEITFFFVYFFQIWKCPFAMNNDNLNWIELNCGWVNCLLMKIETILIIDFDQISVNSCMKKKAPNLRIRSIGNMILLFVILLFFLPFFVPNNLQCNFLVCSMVECSDNLAKTSLSYHF